jgi:hypothetical protein
MLRKWDGARREERANSDLSRRQSDLGLKCAPHVQPAEEDADLGQLLLESEKPVLHEGMYELKGRKER